MLRRFALIGLTGALSFAAWTGVSAAASKPPVKLSGKTNVHGQKDLSSSSNAKLELEQDDFYFSPTFIKVKAGEQLTVTLKNEGKTAHTFTSKALNVDETVQPDKTAKVTVTIPAAGGTVEFFCDFHQSMGMQGAFYTGKASGQAAAGTTTTTGVANATVSLASTRLGTVLVDSTGHTLYVFDRDTPTTVNCTGGCATTWPAVIATGTPTAGAGLDASKLAVVAGPSGNQVTYGGHPLYRYAQDQATGDVNGQGVGGIWWVVGADGQKITT
jgi:predicted lipoprotein with Yx(FWY)xxD motif/uncharacterized cupredoxin-like copper-binding protein